MRLSDKGKGSATFEVAGMTNLRRFPAPWSAEELDACFVVRDHSGQAAGQSATKLKLGDDVPDRIANSHLA
jgi:hypothetical protein